MSDRDRDFYDYRPPIPVADGIRARSRRGDIGASWWSKRFVAALDEYYTTTASRLARGRSYARAGQVVRMDLSTGLVEAVVQGSRATPYTVSIKVKVLSDRDWRRVEAAMAARAVFLARLLSGEMPNEIEEAFAEVRVSLFPSRRGDLRTRCSCPDTANPCKHIAAVFYLLAESFDRDPFRMFEWRGRPRERLIDELRALRPGADRGRTPRRGRGAPAGDEVEAARSLSAALLDPASLDRFWNGRSGWAEVRIEPHPTSPPDALIREMDPDVIRVLGPDSPATLRSLYLAVAKDARRRLDPEAGRDAGRDAGRERPRRDAGRERPRPLRRSGSRAHSE
ncbi:MAG TPA: SWIM zinc finger family protein [Candidatus Limnocylindrales bacterium]